MIERERKKKKTRRQTERREKFSYAPEEATSNACIPANHASLWNALENPLIRVLAYCATQCRRALTGIRVPGTLYLQPPELLRPGNSGTNTCRIINKRASW